MAGPDWVRAAHKADVIQSERRGFSDRMNAACALSWSKDKEAAGPRPLSDMEEAVRFYRETSRRQEWHPGIDDGEGDPGKKEFEDRMFDLVGEVTLEGVESPVLEETAGKSSLYLGLCKAQTGDTIPDEVLEQRRSDTVQLREMSHEIAGRLEANGFSAYRDDKFSLYHFYVHSGFLDKIPSFRRVIIVPYIAAMTRASMLSAAEFFIEQNPFSRFWTFTSGKRCNVLQVRKRLQDMHRKISLLNYEPFMKEAGLQIVLRSSELGTPETDRHCSTLNNSGEIEQQNGEFLFHPHAHCIVHLSKGFINRKKWDNIIEKVWAYWVDHWDAGKVIGNVRECLKYVTKPGEMLKLPGADLAELAKQLRRLKLAQPMGVLAEQIKERRESGLRLIRQKTPDGLVLAEVKDWNKLPATTQEEKDRIAAMKLDVHQEKPMTRVVSRLLPAIGPSGVKEPRVVVMTNERLDVALLRLHPAIAPVIACSVDEYFAGLAIRVHTCTSTVLPGLDILELSSWKPPP
jgi:hypothetical protein